MNTLEPVTICPDCGGHLTRHVGRWMYSEKIEPWWIGFFAIGGKETVYHKFIKGRDCESLSTTQINIGK